jgi:hypothetical protein
VRSNETEAESGYVLVGDSHLVNRVDRMILLGRRVGEGRFEAGLGTPHQAYLTLLAVLRDHGQERHLPIDFAGVDDDGLPMDFMPVPEADHLLG